MSQQSAPALAREGLYNPAFEHDACGVGFVAHIKGQRSHGIVRQALDILNNLEHRGACGCESNTGDGAGILTQLPHAFFQKVCPQAGINLPAAGQYGAGLVFLPRDAAQAAGCRALCERIAEEEGQRVLGWREVPVNPSGLGPTALSCMPAFQQVFIERCAGLDEEAFERRLYVIRKRLEHSVRRSEWSERGLFYVPSLSSRTLIYKGMLTTAQVEELFLDLSDPALESALALVHSRFSTNTFPSWPLAHPFRYVAHNGEINTLRGNINWMRARESLCATPLLGEDLKKILPIVMEDGSDSATFDNVLEFLHMAGRPLPLAVLMMIPEAWSGHEEMDAARKAFYEYHGCLMEPWDGPASIAFTDGRVIGAVLDRNGLRPSRYYVTHDDLVVMASEVGVLDIPPEKVRVKERLHPGRVFLVDMQQGRIIDDAELKAAYAAAQPYAQWLADHLMPLARLPAPPRVPEPDHATVLHRQQMYGYTQEDLKILLAPMARNGEEAIGSMGHDAALAVLSSKPRLLYDYFFQLFAQVTNPPLDAIREELVTQVSTTLGAEGNLLDPQPESCRHIKLDSPILDNEDLARIRHCGLPQFRSQTLSMLFDPLGDGAALEAAMSDLCAAAEQAIDSGASILILSDREAGPSHAAIPALLAVAGVHHHLVRAGKRARAGLVVESGEPREVHHMALLLGYGVGAINPYLAFETLDDMIHGGLLPGLDHAKAVKNYLKALNKGVTKVMSKMGISTIQSYRGAQIFEAVGLAQEFVDRYFTWTATRIGGIGLDVVAEEVRRRHALAWPLRGLPDTDLAAGGEYQWRRDGEYHLFNPDTVYKLQHATRSGQYAIFKEYTALVDDQARHLATLRGLMGFKPAGAPVPLVEVEPVEAIMRRFASGAMSFGSISAEAHETLAIAMNRIGGRSNSGEGGEDPARYGTERNSRIKQVASGRFGVTSHYLANADDLQIKMAQGAKPGEGGQLPGGKVYPWIARVRHSTPGVGLISPPPHHDIYSIEDLAQLIYDLKCANPRARVHVKLVAEVGVGTVAAGVSKAHADVVLISGHDGGTGASPLSSLKHAGVPWELGLAETQQVLVKNRLRDRIVVQVDGQMKTGRDVVIAALLGGEEFGFSTAPLVVMGCIMMRVCHLNTCPVGVATQDPRLRAKFSGKPEFVMNFFRYIAEEVREHMAALGFRTLAEMIGRSDCLDMRPALDHWKARGLDYSRILAAPQAQPGDALYQVQAQDHGVERSLDVTQLIPQALPAIERCQPVEFSLPIRNLNRTVGATLGYEVSRRHGAAGLPDGSIRVRFTGSAGQSFGGFLPRGVSFTLEGDANDYCGKGLSGGRIAVFPPPQATFRPEDNIIIGNVALYGATAGEAYFRGIAGERFAVRNSGARAVVEGVGDHGCEYMTGGLVVVLGSTGRNFAAGMSGGVAFVLDRHGQFARRCNVSMVGLEDVSEPEDVAVLKDMIAQHQRHTGSTVAAELLLDWPAALKLFVKVMPRDYKKVQAALARARASGAGEDEAMDRAFKEVVGG
jgi:glutamate synthase (ferredoxin)